MIRFSSSLVKSLPCRPLLRQLQYATPIPRAMFKQATRPFGTYWDPKLDPKYDWKNPKNRDFYVDSNPFRTPKRNIDSVVFRWRHLLWLIGAFAAYPLVRSMLLAEESKHEEKTSDDLKAKKPKSQMTHDEREARADRASRLAIQRIYDMSSLITPSPDSYTSIPARVGEYMAGKWVIVLSNINNADFRTLSFYEVDLGDEQSAQLFNFNPSAHPSIDFIVPTRMAKEMTKTGSVSVKGPFQAMKVSIQSDNSYVVIGEGDIAATAVNQLFGEFSSVEGRNKCHIDTVIICEDVNEVVLRDSIYFYQMRQESAKNFIRNSFVAAKAEDYQFDGVGQYKVHKSLQSVLLPPPGKKTSALIIGSQKTLDAGRRKLEDLGYDKSQITEKLISYPSREQ